MKLTEKHLSVLRTARNFAPVIIEPLEKASKSGGQVMATWTMSEHEASVLASELVGAGLLARKQQPYMLEKKAKRYSTQLTDAGRKAARGEDQDLSIDRARPMHSSDLRNVWGDHQVAQCQLELRASGGAIVRGALKATVGREYGGTGGWHITAYVTPERRIGFVNIAHGVACLTAAELTAEQIEALTIPEQAPGVLFSGAIAWTAPDAGEGSKASAPPGWTQLVLDIRATANTEPATEIADASARIVMWGLATCYQYEGSSSKLGAPGFRSLEALSAQRSPISEWPMSRETRGAIADITEQWLDRVARRLAALAGVSEQVAAGLDSRHDGKHPAYAAVSDGSPILPRADIVAAMRWDSEPTQFAYDASSAVRSAVSRISDPPRDALRACGLARLASCERSNVGGMRYYDLIRRLLERALQQRLDPISATLWAQLEPLQDPLRAGDPEHHQRWALHQTLVPILERLAGEIAKPMLREVEEEAGETERAIVAAYYAQGPVVVDIPCEIAAVS